MFLFILAVIIFLVVIAFFFGGDLTDEDLKQSARKRFIYDNNMPDSSLDNVPININADVRSLQTLAKNTYNEI